MNDETMVFMRNLELLFRAPRGGASKEHLDEFAIIQTEYNNHIKARMKEDFMPEITLEMSQSFYDTWVWRTFQEIFKHQRDLRKPTAKALNELFRSLNNNENNEDFLLNYSRYRD